MAKTEDQLTEELREELRSIIRMFDRHRRAPKAEPVELDGKTVYRVEGFDSPEAAQDDLCAFAGRVWQLKDPLKQYAKARNLKTTTKKGKIVPLNIEEEVKRSKYLLTCADLWNYEKHKVNDNRSGIDPVLNVSFTMKGTHGFSADGAAKQYSVLVEDPAGAIRNANVVSRDGKYNLGDVVDVIVSGFAHLIPMIRAMDFLNVKRLDDAFILSGLKRIEEDAKLVDQKRQEWAKPT